MLHILVIGTKTFDDSEKLNTLLTRYINNTKICLENIQNVEIICGAECGVDTFVKEFAFKNGYPYKEFFADWNKYGKAAEAVLNEELQQYISQYTHKVCVAFLDGNNKDMESNFVLAKKYNNDLITIQY